MTENESKTEKIAVRLPKKHLELMDYLIANHEYLSRSEIMRHAVKEFLEKHVPALTEKLKTMQQARQSMAEVENIEKKFMQK
ncbi:MAG: ribbon-helix-helix domain-containing protein [Thermoplasmata archaeon]